MDDRSGSAKWKHWASAGALATATLGSEADAVACHEDPDVPGYEKSSSIGASIGVSFGRGVRFMYGLDLRMTSGQKAAIVRFEGRGLTSVRLVIAGHLVADGQLGAEIGLALHSRHAGSDIGNALAFHLAGGPYDGGGGLQAHASLPFLGDLRNYEGGVSAVLVPNEVKLFCGGGRRLRDGDRTVLPGVAALDGGEACGALARAWIEDARAEYASIAAFERMALELQSAGAPAALVRAARSAAEDEARHTALCTEMAGAPIWMLPLAPGYSEPRWTARGSDALVTLAREAWLDGCLGEGIAAAHAARAAGSARHRAVDVQRTIADDERRHAELAWAILDWTWRDGGARVRDAIAEAAGAEPEVPAMQPLDGDPALFAAAGRISPEAARAAGEREIGEALERVRRMIG